MNKYNVRTINKKIIEVDGKLVKNNTVPKAPAWFTAFEIKIDQRFQKIEDILERNNLK